jgi:hypothetical protein
MACRAVGSALGRPISDPAIQRALVGRDHDDRAEVQELRDEREPLDADHQHRGHRHHPAVASCRSAGSPESSETVTTRRDPVIESMTSRP